MGPPKELLINGAHAYAQTSITQMLPVLKPFWVF